MAGSTVLLALTFIEFANKNNDSSIQLLVSSLPFFLLGIVAGRAIQGLFASTKASGPWTFGIALVVQAIVSMQVIKNVNVLAHAEYFFTAGAVFGLVMCGNWAVQWPITSHPGARTGYSLSFLLLLVIVAGFFLILLGLSGFAHGSYKYVVYGVLGIALVFWIVSVIAWIVELAQTKKH